MHNFARRLHSSPKDTTPHETKKTKGLVLDLGWRYDLMVWSTDTFLLRGQINEMRQRTLALARLQPDDHVLDIGCGTGALAIEAQRRIGSVGHVVGIDPGAQQIARAQAKAARRNLPVDFQIGVVEQLAFPDQSFDVVLSTLMFHHLGARLKRQALAEVARILKPGGRLIIADFTSKKDRQGRAAHFHAGGSNLQELASLLQDAGFTLSETEDMRPKRFSAFPGAGLLVATKRPEA